MDTLVKGQVLSVKCPPLRGGFTILEVVIAIGIIAIISGVAFINLNPARQLSKARNVERWSAVNSVLNAIGLRISDTRGVFEAEGTGGSPPACAAGAIPTTLTQLGSGQGNYDIEPCLVPVHMPPPMPLDPLGGTTEATGYFIQQDATTGRVTVSAPNAELGDIISKTR